MCMFNVSRNISSNDILKYNKTPGKLFAHNFVCFLTITFGQVAMF